MLFYRYLYLILIILMIISSGCRITRKLAKNQNLSYIYNPGSSIMHPQVRIFHNNDTITQLFFKISKNELKFIRSNENTIYTARIKVRYVLFNNFEKSEVIDSSSCGAAPRRPTRLRARRTKAAGPSIWDVFSHTPGKIHNGDTGDVADDSYHLYKEDVRCSSNLGVGAYRMSISWPRIFPEGTGQPNPAGLDYYKRVIDELLENGITPYVTLFHWDLPAALPGGWQSRYTALAFADYAGLRGAAALRSRAPLHDHERIRLLYRPGLSQRPVCAGTQAAGGARRTRCAITEFWRTGWASQAIRANAPAAAGGAGGKCNRLRARDREPGEHRSGAARDARRKRAVPDHGARRQVSRQLPASAKGRMRRALSRAT